MIKQTIFFTPTIISLLTVVVLLFSFHRIASSLSSQKFESYKLILLSETGPYGEVYLKQLLQKKKITTYILNGIEDDSLKLQFIREDALRMKFTCDTLSVIKVHFSTEATYGEFFNLNKMMEEAIIKRYVFSDPNFYIFGHLYQDCLDEKPEDTLQELKYFDL